jgi:hypothetical protein
MPCSPCQVDTKLLHRFKWCGQMQVYGIRNRVFCKDACAQIPEGMLLLEVGQHSILRARKVECGPSSGNATASFPAHRLYRGPGMQCSPCQVNMKLLHRFKWCKRNKTFIQVVCPTCRCT